MIDVVMSFQSGAERAGTDGGAETTPAGGRELQAGAGGGGERTTEEAGGAQRHTEEGGQGED